MIWTGSSPPVNLTLRAALQEENHICLLSKQSSEDGGGEVGLSILCSSPVCHSCRQLWATVSASCQDCDWPGRAEPRPKPRVTPLPMTASDGRVLGGERKGKGYKTNI